MFASDGSAFVAVPAATTCPNVGFTIAVYAIRHGVYAAMGLTYRHDPWLAVFRYEIVKFGLFYLLFVAILTSSRCPARRKLPPRSGRGQSTSTSIGMWSDASLRPGADPSTSHPFSRPDDRPGTNA